MRRGVMSFGVPQILPVDQPIQPAEDLFAIPLATPGWEWLTGLALNALNPGLRRKKADFIGRRPFQFLKQDALNPRARLVVTLLVQAADFFLVEFSARAKQVGTGDANARYLVDQQSTAFVLPAFGHNR